MGCAGAVVAPLLVARSRGRVPASPGLAVSLGSCSPFPCCIQAAAGLVAVPLTPPARRVLGPCAQPSSLRPARRLIARASFAPDLSLCINFSSAAWRCCHHPASRGLVALPAAAFALGLQPRPLQASPWGLESSLCRKLDREPDEVKNNTIF